MTAQKTCLPTQLDLLESTLEPPLTEEKALALMVLLHTHQIHLRAALASNGPATDNHVEILAPLTHRGAAEVVAALWPDRSDERANYAFWYWQYNTRTPYEDLSQVPKEMMPALVELRHRLAKNPRVRAVVEDF